MIAVRHRLPIATAIGLGLIVIAANLATPRWWLLVPGWLTLLLCLAIYVISIPDSSPYKSALIYPAPAYFILLGLWEWGSRSLLRLILHPSERNFYSFVAGKGFLVLTIAYFVFVCIFYSQELKSKDDQLADYKRIYGERTKELERCEERLALHEDNSG